MIRFVIKEFFCYSIEKRLMKRKAVKVNCEFQDISQRGWQKFRWEIMVMFGNGCGSGIGRKERNLKYIKKVTLVKNNNT